MNPTFQLRKQALLALFVLLWVGLSGFSSRGQIISNTPTPTNSTAINLIELINNARKSRGLLELNTDAVLMGSAQATVEFMASQSMTARVSGVRERVMAAGYGNGDIAWADESVIIFQPNEDWPATLNTWLNDSRNMPVSNPDYRHIGVGTANSMQGNVYCVIQVAYTSNGNYQPKQSTPEGNLAENLISEAIFSVQTVTPQADGQIVHLVKPGQSLWSIAIAYGTHIEDLQRLNNISRDNFTIYAGQKLLIPLSAELAKDDASNQIFIIDSIPTETPASLEPEETTPTVVPSQQIDQPVVFETPDGDEKFIPETGQQKSQSIIPTLAVTAAFGVILFLIGLLLKG